MIIINLVLEVITFEIKGDDFNILKYWIVLSTTKTQ